jgi:hypothetical protein
MSNERLNSLALLSIKNATAQKSGHIRKYKTFCRHECQKKELLNTF